MGDLTVEKSMKKTDQNNMMKYNSPKKTYKKLSPSLNSIFMHHKCSPSQI